MFTGIVEEIGIVKEVKRKKNLSTLTITAKKIWRGIKQGDSIAVDGVCLTVTRKRGRLLTFDVMKETLRASLLGDLKAKDCVNLERSLRLNGRLDGHFVTGHVDGVGTVREKLTRKNYVEIKVGLTKALLKYIVPKGSVSVNGVSLTVGEVKTRQFSFYMIPYTKQMTTLRSTKMGDKVNIETDLLAKYILK